MGEPLYLRHVVPQTGYNYCLAATTDSRWTHPRRLTVATGARTRRGANEAQAPMLTGACSQEQRQAHGSVRSRGASASQRGSGACALSRGSASQAVETTGLHDRRRPARSPAGRAACRVVMTSGLHTGQGLSGAERPPGRRGVARRPESLPGWRAFNSRGSIPGLAGVGVVRGL